MVLINEDCCCIFLLISAGFEITKKNHCDGDIFKHSFRLPVLELERGLSKVELCSVKCVFSYSKCLMKRIKHADFP